MDRIIDGKDLWSGCSFEACARTEVELFEEILEHGQAIHGISEFSEELYHKVRASIQKGYCDLEEELCKHSDCYLS